MWQPYHGNEACFPVHLSSRCLETFFFNLRGNVPASTPVCERPLLWGAGSKLARKHHAITALIVIFTAAELNKGLDFFVISAFLAVPSL